MPPEAFEPAIPASERLQNRALEGAATGICRLQATLILLGTVTSLEIQVFPDFTPCGLVNIYGRFEGP
jgi:hypothetical protein